MLANPTTVSPLETSANARTLIQRCRYFTAIHHFPAIIGAEHVLFHEAVYIPQNFLFLEHFLSCFWDTADENPSVCSINKFRCLPPMSSNSIWAQNLSSSTFCACSMTCVDDIFSQTVLSSCHLFSKRLTHISYLFLNIRPFLFFLRKDSFTCVTSRFFS